MTKVMIFSETGLRMRSTSNKSFSELNGTLNGTVGQWKIGVEEWGEDWSTGVLEYWGNVDFPLFHYFITPSLHYSNVVLRGPFLPVEKAIEAGSGDTQEFRGPALVATSLLHGPGNLVFPEF